jgi:hypothetical protein
MDDGCIICDNWKESGNNCGIDVTVTSDGGCVAVEAIVERATVETTADAEVKDACDRREFKIGDPVETVKGIISDGVMARDGPLALRME